MQYDENNDKKNDITFNIFQNNNFKISYSMCLPPTFYRELGGNLFHLHDDVFFSNLIPFKPHPYKGICSAQGLGYIHDDHG